MGAYFFASPYPFQTWLIVLLLALTSGMTTIIGTLLGLWIKKSSQVMAAGVGFAAGIMIMISLGELLPEAYAEAGLVRSAIFFGAGVGVLAFLNRILPHLHAFEVQCTGDASQQKLLKTAYLCAAGLILHDFPEGFAMANSYLVSPHLGLFLTIAIAVHNIPEEFSLAVPIIASGRNKRLLYKAAFISGLAEPVGAVVGLMAASVVPQLTPVFLAFAAGAMMFISFHELIPLAYRYRHPWDFALGFGASAVVFFGLTILLPA